MADLSAWRKESAACRTRFSLRSDVEIHGNQKSEELSAVHQPPILLGTLIVYSLRLERLLLSAGMKPFDYSSYSSRSACIGFAVAARSAGIIVAIIEDETSSRETQK